jgi:nicotinate-nucleotide adenylyltransferase
VRRIGLFGGTFDPPHRAHVALAHAALEALALDELRWVPAGQPWQKTRRITPADHRLAMLHLAIGDEPRFALERCEIDREGPSYTVDTVQQLGAQDGASADAPTQWFLLIGQDQLARLHTWHRWHELPGRVTLAVAARPGVVDAADPAVLAAWAAQTSGSHAGHPGPPWASVPLPPMAISATQVRARAALGLPLDDLVPTAVARYIEQHHLYREEAAGH